MYPDRVKPHRLNMLLEDCLQNLQRVRELCPSGQWQVMGNSNPETHFFGLVHDGCESVAKRLTSTGLVSDEFKAKPPDDDQSMSFEIMLVSIQSAQQYVEEAIGLVFKTRHTHGGHLGVPPLNEALSRAYAVLDVMLPVARRHRANEREHPKVRVSLRRADAEELLKRDDLSDRVREAIKDSL